MKNFLKYLGAIIVLVGVLFLVLYHFGVKANAMLVIALILIVAGLIAQIILNKRVQ